MVYAAIFESRMEVARKMEIILSKLYHHEIHIFTCESIFALENYVLDMRKGNVDILFVSLSASAENIISRVSAMQEDYPNLQVTFLAEEESQVMQIFQANPAYFIKKPVDTQQLQEAMNRMLVRLRKIKKEVLIFESAKGTLILPQDEILYIESSRKEVIFVLTQQRREKGAGKLDDIEPLLGSNFIRCHQSYIVNAGKISRITRKEVVLYNQQTVPVSRPRSKETREAIMKYLSMENMENDAEDKITCNSDKTETKKRLGGVKRGKTLQ